MENQGLSTTMRRILLLINCLILAVGICGGPLMMRLYYVEGGSRVWFSSWLQTAGWPFTLIPLAILYFYRRKTEGINAKYYLITPRIFIASFIIGVVTGLDDFLYSWGGSKLPVSTSSLLLAAQLAFTAVGAFFIVKLKFTPYSINAVVLLTVGAVLLGVRSNGDRPEGVTSKAYILGFMMTLLAAALYGVILPCIELIYLKAKQAITQCFIFSSQVEMQNSPPTSSMDMAIYMAQVMVGVLIWSRTCEDLFANANSAFAKSSSHLRKWARQGSLRICKEMFVIADITRSLLQMLGHFCDWAPDLVRFAIANL
uniref:Probable purine permease n=1 Tax=Nicotiana tabacum TaxID=4097 RepID=A0A1S3Z4Y7_TOBAC|nr:PREDICTED: purine permease 3-like [Nicotiana tabacum]